MQKNIYLYACDRSITYRRTDLGTELVPHVGPHSTEFAFYIAGDAVGESVAIPICRNTRVASMVNRVLEALPTGNDTIQVLRILSHGAPGTISIGENISARNQAEFQPLRRRFAPGSEGAFLYGCRIASEAVVADESHVRTLDEHACTTYYDYAHPAREFEDYMRGHFSAHRAHGGHGIGSIGFTFVCQLAETLGVNVTAAVDRQTDIAVPAGSHRVDSTGYEGQYVTVTPSGNHELHTGTPLDRVFDAACSSYAPG